MRIALSFVVGLALAPAAALSCSSSTDRPADFADPNLPGHAANPEGVAYPTDHIGGVPRASTHPGDRIPNFTFQAYVDGDRAAGLKTISLADYYDPKQLHHRVLHLEVAATWCEVCSAYADATVLATGLLGPEGVVYLEVIAAGQGQSSGPSLGEVDAWVDSHHSNFTTAIDVRGGRLATVGVPPETVPWDIMIDTRTMEILDSNAGTPMDLAAYDRSYLQLVALRGPAY